MDRPKHIEVTIKTSTLRVLLRVYGNTSHSKRLRLGIPEAINRESAAFYTMANRELEIMGYKAVHKEWRPSDET